MIRRNRTIADVGALALAASILFAGSLSAVSAQAAPTSAAVVTAASDRGQSPVINYVALGDSYAAGQGAGPYQNDCLQTELSYPEALDDDKHLKLIADQGCSGATVDEVPGQLSGIKQNKDIDLVTLTVGANDLLQTGALEICLQTPENCEAAIAEVMVLLATELPADLEETFAAVIAAAPDATIIVTGYPLLFETPPTTDPLHDAISRINDATVLLNGAIEQAAGAFGFHYVDVTDDFAGHGIGSPDPWIHSVGEPDAFHPTAAGYAAYAEAIRAELEEL